MCSSFKYMSKKYYLGGLAAIVCVFVSVTPAYAFSLNFKSFFDKFAPVEKIQAQEAGQIAPAAPVMPVEPVNQIQPLPPVNPVNNDGSNNNPSPATCMVNGVNMPGDCSKYPSQSGENGGGNNMMPPAPNQQPAGPNMQSGGGPNDNTQFGPSPEQMAKQNAQRLKEMKNGLKTLRSAVASFEKLMAKGNTLSDALQAKIAQAKELAAKMEAATTADEVSNDDMDTLRELMNDLREEQQSMQRLAEFRKNIVYTERGVKNFERQLTTLQKQKIVIPADVTANLDKIKQLIATVKTATSWEEMQTAGVEDLGDLMDTLNESRNNLEMLARWPKTLKQMDKEITNLNRQVKKAKTVVDRLIKKDIDLTENYNKFVEMADKLKAARDDAKAKMEAGDSEGAFSVAEDSFFGQLEETYQSMKVIETMSNLGTFTSGFKSELNKAKQTIKQLAKKKIDVTELQAIYDETKAKGDETLALIKIKPVDEEAVITAMEELGNLRVDFGNKVSELQGDDVADMPWEQGTTQFKAVQVTSNFNQYFPEQKQPIVGGASSPTCNVNGVEISGTCEENNQN